MKVVCIAIPPTFITIKLTIGNIYEAFYKEHYFFIYDELGNVVPCDAFDKEKYFISLSSHRNQKIGDIIK